MKIHHSRNFYTLKIRRRNGVESLTTLEEGEFKFAIDGCISNSWGSCVIFRPRTDLLHVPEKSGSKKYWQIWCYIKMCFKQSPLAYESNCWIIYLSLAKYRNDFHKQLSRYDYFKCKLRHRTIFVIFLSSGWLTTYKAITESSNFFFLGGVAMVLQHRNFIQKILGTSTICSHGYGFDMP